MKEVYIENIQVMMQDRLDALIDFGKITKTSKIVLFGITRVSSLTRTILAHRGYSVTAYVDNDSIKVMKERRIQKGMGEKYLNDTRDFIAFASPEEILGDFNDSFVILISSRHYKEISRQLMSMGYVENKHFFSVYDFNGDTEFTEYVKDKKLLSLDEIHQVQIKMLKQIDEICEKENLRYWLCGGTLLGAMRHKGFIPWDDDVDIFMPMKDYLKFIELYQDTSDYKLVSPYKYDCADYNIMLSRLFDRRTILRELEFPIRRIGGVCIDIWPLIGMPDDEKERSDFFAKYYDLRKQMWEDFYNSAGSFEAFHRTYEEQIDYLNKYDFDEAKFVGVMPTQYFERDCTHREVYNQTLKRKFEDLELNIPIGYQEYLDNLYGKGWEALPDEKKRKTHHTYDVYWRSNDVQSV